MYGNILLDESPLIVVPSLAVSIGLNESIILQQVHYWLQRSKHTRLNQKWVYFTYDEMVEQIPFFSKSTIRRAIAKLESMGYLSSHNFNKLKLDKTKWYTINYENLNEIKDGNDGPFISIIEEQLPSAQSEQEICLEQADEMFNVTSPPVQDEQTSGSTWHAEKFNLNTAIPEITTEITSKITSETSSSSKVSQQTEVKEDPFQFFEQNGFGTIGSFLADKIKAWCTDLSDELVIEAMKLAIENSSKRWNYVEAVLRDWVDKGYQTLEDVQAARIAYKEQKLLKRPIRQELIPEWLHDKKQPKDPMYNYSFEEKKRLFEEKLKKMREDSSIGE